MSRRMTPAQKWGREFRRAVARRKTNCAAVARAIFQSDSAVQNWHAGHALPSYEPALAAAEELEWARLRSLIVELRTVKCLRCRRDFIAAQNLNARYCSARCRAYKHLATKYANRSRRRYQRVGRMLAIWEEVGDDMCREWCPGGAIDNVCPDASCPIQRKGLCPWPVAGGVLERVA